MSDGILNREWIQTIVTVLCALGILAGFWLSRERDLWQAGTSVKAMNEQISEIKADIKLLKKVILKDKFKEHHGIDPEVQ